VSGRARVAPTVSTSAVPALNSAVIPPTNSGASSVDELLTIEQVAAFLKCVPNSVYNLTRKRGQVRYGDNPFPVVRFPFGMRVRKLDLLGWIDRQAAL